MDPLSPLLLGACLASLLALPLRRVDRRGLGALVAGLAGAAAATWQVAPGSAWIAFAFGVAAFLGWFGVGTPGARPDRRFGDVQGLVKASGRVAGRLPRPSRLLDPADRLRLDRAVYAAESGGEAEIAVALFERCDPYTAARVRFAALLAAAGLLAAALALPEASPALLLLAQVGVAAAALALAGAPPLLRTLLPGAVVQTLVETRARNVFFEAGLHHAPGGAAALVFVASLERRYAIVADDGRGPASAPGEEWEAVARALETAFAEGAAQRGLEAAVEGCAGALRATRDADTPPPATRDLALLRTSVVVEDSRSER